MPSIPRVGNVGVLIEGTDQPMLFHPGDSYEYEPADIDVLALRLNAPWAKGSETVALVNRVAPRIVFPIHDALLSETGRALYWSQVADHG